MFNVSLRNRYILLLAFSAIVIMVFFAVIVFSELQRLHTHMSAVGQAKVSDSLTQGVISRSEQLLERFTQRVSGADLSRRAPGQLQAKLSLLDELPLVERVLVYDARQKVLQDSLSTGLGRNVVSLLPFALPLERQGHAIAQHQLLLNQPIYQQQARSYLQTAPHQEKKIGGVLVFMSLEPIERSIAERHKSIDATLKETQRHFLHSLFFLLLIFGCLILLLSALFSYSISRPIDALMAYSEKLALGQWELPSCLRKGDEFSRLGHAFRQMAMQIQANVRSTENLAFYDQLTGIGNRTFFQQQLTDIAEDREQTDFTVLLVGLDNFKWFNETRGYNAGDELLKQVVSSALVAVNQWCEHWGFSRQQIGIYRLGGDEFGVIVQSELSHQAQTALADALLSVFDSEATAPRRMSGMQASLGVMRASNRMISPAETQTQVAIALNEAKKQGKNRIVYFEPEMDASLQRRYHIEQALLTARAEQQLYMVYQPQIAIDTGQVVGYEALMRWQHPELGFISPGEFFPIAEQMPVIKELGEFVIRQVLQDIPALVACHDGQLKVSLNVSAAQFFYHDVAGIILQGMREHSISPHQLGVELTETSLLEKDQVVVEQLQRMRDAGLNILLDDFGTGYASLNYLKEFPITGLKLDRSYTARLCSGEHADFALFESLLFLAKNLGLSTVVEGIENEHEEQQALLAGAHIAQGFKYAAGKPLEQVLEQQAGQTPEPVLN